jgi:hypothetical protein
METIDLVINTQSFNDNKYLLSLKGFYIKFESKIYIFSIHHNLPINNVSFNDIKIDIIINSRWSDVLILDGEQDGFNYNKDYVLHKTIQNKLPNIDSIVNMKDYLLQIVDYEFINIDNINMNSPDLPFIKCKLLNDDDIDYSNFKGLSGTPIFLNDKIIGTFSHYNQNRNKYIYILPIYIYIKNLKKKNNNDIYTFDYNVNKINRYNVIDATNNVKIIYHNKLNINVPLSTYFLLELDSNNILINTNNNDYILENKNINDIKTNNILLLDYNNDNNIILNDNIYTINIRLLKLMKHIGINRKILLFLVKFNKKQLSINNNKIITD